MLEHRAGLAVTLSNDAAVTTYVGIHEAVWAGYSFNDEINHLVGLRTLIVAGLNGLKVGNATAALGWAQIVPFLQTLQAVGLITVVANNVNNLGGGHGPGVFWTATVTAGGAQIQTGTIPNAGHSRTDGARTGARAAAQEVARAHDDALTALATAAGQLATS